MPNIGQKITPFLWFNDNAEEAAKFYVATFKNSKITQTVKHGEGGPGKKGTAMTVAFVLDGQEFVGLNGGPTFQFTPAVSFVVTCETQKEIDALWKRFTKDGQESRCGWLQDKFGLSWQIVPAGLGELLSKPGAMQAMMGMKKLDIKALKAAGKAPQKHA